MKPQTCWRCEIERIHKEALSFERIEAISDPMRELIEDLWQRDTSLPSRKSVPASIT